MKLSRVLEALLSGCVVYTLVVACSGGGAGGGGFLADAANDLFGQGGGGVAGDVLSDPVPEAQAAPPEVKDAPCAVNINGGIYAEVAFPGKTLNELAVAQPFVHATTGMNGYEWVRPISVLIKDGSVLVLCYTQGGTAYYDGARVVLPSSG